MGVNDYVVRRGGSRGREKSREAKKSTLRFKNDRLGVWLKLDKSEE